MKDKNGPYVGWGTCLQETMVEYFNELFKASNTEWGEVISSIEPKIAEEHNRELLIPIAAEEVKKALFGMHLDKSPGPDGMIPRFYQKYWKIMGADVVNMVQNFFVTSKFELRQIL